MSARDRRRTGLYSLTVDFNLSAFVIGAFWLLISCRGVILALRDRSRSELWL